MNDHAHQREVIPHKRLGLDLSAGLLRGANAEIDMLADDPRDELVGCTVVHDHSHLRVGCAESTDGVW